VSKGGGYHHTFNYDLINSKDPNTQVSSVWHIPSVPKWEKLHDHGGWSEDRTGATIASRWLLGDVLEADLHVTSRDDPAHGRIGRVAAVEVPAPDPVGACWTARSQHLRDPRVL
jgi:hypothetical protein